jgi:mRNA interferase RelE/StbE
VPYRVEFKPSARRQLRKLPAEVQRRIVLRAEALGGDPRPPGVEALAGADALYRVRVGDYRIVYEVRDRILLVLVVRIGHRREVYRGL